MQATHQIQPYDVQRGPDAPAGEASAAHADLPVNVHAYERLASVLVGGALVVRGLAHRGRGRSLLVVGSGLVYRGVTGHCHVYDFLRVSTAEGRRLRA